MDAENAQNTAGGPGAEQAADLMAEPTRGGGALARRRRVPRAVAVGLAIVLGLVAAMVAFDLGTASPDLCASCHEMGPRHASWAESAHVSVTCVECHQTPTAFYALPQRVVGRARLLGRDVIAHLKGDYDDPVDGPIAGSVPMKDVVCLDCHDPNRKATSGFRILIDHPEHARRNGSCVSCHVRTAHPIESRGTAMSLMTQCYTCHGTAEHPEASDECGVCHPAGFELFPVSHTERTWAMEHGTTSQEDPRQCVMCHEERFCGDCHGLAMPHPEDWTEGEGGHALTAASDRDVCDRCHLSAPDWCDACHHPAYDEAKGPWVDQHYGEVRAAGTAACFNCHGPLFCVNCHKARVDAGPIDPSQF